MCYVQWNYHIILAHIPWIITLDQQKLSLTHFLEILLVLELQLISYEARFRPKIYSNDNRK